MPTNFAVSGGSVSGNPLVGAATPVAITLRLGGLGGTPPQCCCGGSSFCTCSGCSVPLQDLILDIDPELFVGGMTASSLVLKQVGGSCNWQARFGFLNNFEYIFDFGCLFGFTPIVFTITLQTSGLTLRCSTPASLAIKSLTCGNSFDMRVEAASFTSCQIFNPTTKFHIHT